MHYKVTKIFYNYNMVRGTLDSTTTLEYEINTEETTKEINNKHENTTK